MANPKVYKITAFDAGGVPRLKKAIKTYIVNPKNLGMSFVVINGKTYRLFGNYNEREFYRTKESALRNAIKRAKVEQSLAMTIVNKYQKFIDAMNLELQSLENSKRKPNQASR